MSELYIIERIDQDGRCPINMESYMTDDITDAYNCYEVMCHNCMYDEKILAQEYLGTDINDTFSDIARKADEKEGNYYFISELQKTPNEDMMNILAFERNYIDGKDYNSYVIMRKMQMREYFCGILEADACSDFNVDEYYSALQNHYGDMGEIRKGCFCEQEQEK